MTSDPVFVAAGNDKEATVLDRSFGQRDPNGEEKMVVSLRRKHTGVLMPAGIGAGVHVATHRLIGNARPELLRGMTEDLRTDQRLGNVEQLRVLHEIEDGRAAGIHGI